MYKCILKNPVLTHTSQLLMNIEAPTVMFLEYRTLLNEKLKNESFT